MIFVILVRNIYSIKIDTCIFSQYCESYFLFLVPPRITDNAHEFTVIKDNPVQLPCEVIGVPPPTVSWYQGDDELEESDNYVFLPNGAFRINRVQEEHSGVYQCLAVNIAGNDTKLVTLTVQGKPVRYKC